MKTVKEVMQDLEGLATHDPKDLAGMARYGIKTDKAWCVSTPNMTKLAGEIKKTLEPGERHSLALGIWKTHVREAMILAAFIDDPKLLSEKQMEEWANDFDSWDVCDTVCTKIFCRHPLGWKKAMEWSGSKKEYVKRAGFVTMATLAVHDKKAEEKAFYPFLRRIKKESTDERNMVKKAVNWALRTIGKARTKNLYERALKTAREIKKIDSSAARFIAGDAIRELTNTPYILKRFGG